MNKISNALKCVNCKSILKAPILLPCEHSICKHHLEKCEDKTIECILCNAKHEIPEKGFPNNKALADIIDAQIQTLILGKFHDDAKQACNMLEKLTTDVTKITDDPLQYTCNEIKLVKKALEDKREELKKKIDQECDKMLKSLDDLDEKCKKNLEENECKIRLAKLVEQNDALKGKLTEWEAVLDDLKQNDEKWSRIKYESETEKKNLEDILRAFKQVILFNDFENLKQFIIGFRKMDFDFKYQSIELDSIIVDMNLSRQQLYNLCQFPMNLKWSLLYRASIHGFDSKEFHSRCDNKNGGTLTIIKTTNGSIFGGFTQALWNSVDNSIKFNPVNLKPDPTAFIFSFRNTANRPIKLNLGNKNQAIYCYDLCGPSFGQFDFLIKTNSNTNNSSFSNLGASYIHQNFYSGSAQAHSFLAGTKHFQVVEIEVFQRLDETLKKTTPPEERNNENIIDRKKTPTS